MQTNLTRQDARELAEAVAFQQLAELSVQGESHASRMCRLDAGGWQGEVIRAARGVSVADDAAGLRRAMEDPAAVAVFLSMSAMVTEAIIRRICQESPLSKLVIWETARA